ncbi:FAD-dependent oxidoreductase [Streptomyces boncukensis]|uniref:FAD-dependent oxidoreductase n=1 Tax=Streptomyces boncukensis TaxID=2711219 RepID=A0A6G4X1X7_9ACTN|nr:FAD-dependent oxidoreductase [Streptomyces boncukensis]
MRRGAAPGGPGRTGRHVVIVGAGPAGFAAADWALAAGARVTLVDLADRPGGQYHRRPPGAPGPPSFERRRARVLAHPRCAWRSRTAVWALEQRDGDGDGGAGLPPLVHTLHGPADAADRPRAVLAPDALVLAPGAHDRVLPFPGWELPGVVTAGAAQALAKGQRVAVGRRVVVAGTGPFLLPVAASLLAAGARVREVCEANGAGTLAAGWSHRPWQLAAAGGKAAELLRHTALLARHRVPFRTGRTVVEARGEGRVEEVVTAALRPDWSVVPGSRRTLSTDAVCVGHGFTPQLELPLAAGCALDGGFVAVDGAQRAGAPGVFAAGEITGVAGAPAARAEGALAGWCAAGGDPAAPVLAPLRRARDQGRRFARRLARAHPVGAEWPGWLREDTVVCRCETARYGALCAAAADPASGDPRVGKLATRAGLGPCQARICGPAVAELTARLRGQAPPTDWTPHRRPIAQPIRLGELARPARSTRDAEQEEHDPHAPHGEHDPHGEHGEHGGRGQRT